MEKEKLHVYFVPGLAASTAIFEYIKLPEQEYEIHLLPWLVPVEKKESLHLYAQRMCSLITEKNFVLVGVSFGGIVVQEMSRHCKPLKVIIISSVKHHNELPLRLKVVKNTKAYKLTPIKMLTNIEQFAKYTYGDFIKKRAKLYQKYLSMRDENYLPWAIYNVLHWKQETVQNDIIHIHGNNDKIFPIKNIKNCIVIEGGTHVMILYKAKTINTILATELSKLSISKV
jgi:esterase/lipase